MALAWLHLEYISVAMGTAAGLCLVWGLLRSSHAMAYRDDLTGLLGRRALNERLKTLGRNYGIAMLDVDHFKRFNDTHGHEAGNRVLQSATRLWRREIRQIDIPCRYGGEEFIIVLPNTPIEGALAVAEDIRTHIEELKIEHKTSPVHPHVTISLGVSTYYAGEISYKTLIEDTDKALYRAKRNGRNRVEAFE